MNSFQKVYCVNDWLFPQNYLLSAINASLEAGKKILEIYKTDFTVTHKNDCSPLTEADRRAHTVIEELLRTTELPIISEEGEEVNLSQRKHWQEYWIIDPLDGTKEFVKKNGEFSVNIALIQKNIPVLGIIYIPVGDRLYFGIKNIGSYLLEKASVSFAMGEDCRELIKRSAKLPNTSSGVFTIATSRSHYNPMTNQAIRGLGKNPKEVRFISSGSSIKFCLVAEGKADFYPRFGPTMEWDTAAGQIIAEEAGKTVIDYLTNQPMKYNKNSLRNNWFMVI